MWQKQKGRECGNRGGETARKGLFDAGDCFVMWEVQALDPKELAELVEIYLGHFRLLPTAGGEVGIESKKMLDLAKILLGNMLSGDRTHSGPKDPEDSVRRFQGSNQSKVRPSPGESYLDTPLAAVGIVAIETGFGGAFSRVATQ